MNKLSLAMCALVVSLWGCGSCNDSAAGNNVVASGCADEDGDGFEAGPDCEEDLDCDDSSASVNPDAEEACDLVDNNCDGDVDEGCESCAPGQTRPCGSDEGECTAGTQACAGGRWDACSGQGPVSETCNGLDDNCDGAIDEGDRLCDDGLTCNGVSVCEDGACTPLTMPDCSELDSPCAIGMCSEKDGGCRAFPRENGSPCEDGDFCTLTGVCSAGVCENTEPRDCSMLDDECNTGVCDEDADTCVAVSFADGTGCNDGSFCSVGDTCLAGVCSGSPRNCVALSDQCNMGVCDDQLDQCVRQPLAVGTPCDDGRYCNVGEACTNGACEGGAPRDCSALGGSCRTGVCNEATDACDGPPLPDGTLCDDNQFCTTLDTCQSGSCVGSQQRDCSTQDTLCEVGTCDDVINQCVAVAVADGMPCDDGLFCTDGDICMGGTCTTAPLDCSSTPMGDPCLRGICSETSNMCTTEQIIPRPPECCPNEMDLDLDGFPNCRDCDDTNGAVYPGAMEFCNGIDDDCDGLVDEDFDLDADTFATCGNDPFTRDCDDTVATTYPGAPELCGANNLGNGVDDNCNGYIDEGCGACSTADADMDGVTECDGDCEDDNPTTYPGAPEVCDGSDNDCNRFTTMNCDVSETCNHDLDGDYDNDADVCMPNRICAQEIDNGNPTGNFFCTSFCNTSVTGALGDGCTATQTCRYDLLRSAAVHGCGEQIDPVGTKLGGETCSSNAECRSLTCINIAGAGPPIPRCYDYCGSDAYCEGANTRCMLLGGEDGVCLPANFFPAENVGDACTANSQCSHLFCARSPQDSRRYCTKPCCTESDCPGGFTCSLRGNHTDTNFVTTPPGAPSCAVDNDCGDEDGDVCFNSLCSWRLVETGSMCLPDAAGQGSRVAGQSCTQNTDCASDFCELDLGVCVDVCCSDATCPNGLGCEFVTVETKGSPPRATSARVCLNLSTDGIIRRR